MSELSFNIMLGAASFAFLTFAVGMLSLLGGV